MIMCTMNLLGILFPLAHDLGLISVLAMLHVEHLLIFKFVNYLLSDTIIAAVWAITMIHPPDCTAQQLQDNGRLTSSPFLLTFPISLI